MRRQALLGHPSTVNKRQPLLTGNKTISPSSSAFSSPSEPVGTSRIGEVAGGAAAGCAALCCCCPCMLLNILFMTVYKVPAGLCRLAWQKKRRREVSRKGLLPRPGGDSGVYEGRELRTHPTAQTSTAADGVKVERPVEAEEHAFELEKEMWDKFYGTGFWRSPSQRSNA